ncbi:MAG: hypothetical protein ACJ8C4_05630 [Gemmataceae bacterium]
MVAGMAGGNFQYNVFLYDRQADTTKLVTHAAGSPLVSSNAFSNSPIISRNGQFISYSSTSTDLVAGQADTNNANDVFLYDVQSGVNSLVSHAYNSTSTVGNDYSEVQSYTQGMSDDGRFVGFASAAANLVPGFVQNNTGASDLDSYFYDRLTGAVTLLSHDSNMSNAGGNNDTFAPSISGDGKFMAFQSNASNLVAGYTNPPNYGYSASDVYIFDRIAGSTTLMSHVAGNATQGGFDSSYAPVLTHDGSFVMYISRSDDLVPGDMNHFADVIAYTRIAPPAVTSVAFGDGTNQRSLVKQLVVTFSEPVSFMGSVASAFTVHRTGTNGTIGDVTLTASPSSGPASSVTITFSGSLTEYGSLVDGLYDVWVDAAQVSGVGGALDGNNDGIAGGSYHLVGTTANKSYRLFGDANGDAAVDQNDYLVFRNALSAGPSVVFDFDNSGDVDQSDYLAFRQRVGAGP